FLTNWQDGSYYLAHQPSLNSANYIRWMMAQRARAEGPFPRHSAMQNQWGCQGGPPNCNLQGGPNGSCGANCTPTCMLTAAFTKAGTYNCDTLEIVHADGAALEATGLPEVCRNATVNIFGGSLRP